MLLVKSSCTKSVASVSCNIVSGCGNRKFFANSTRQWFNDVTFVLEDMHMQIVTEDR